MIAETAILAEQTEVPRNLTSSFASSQELGGVVVVLLGLGVVVAAMFGSVRLYRLALAATNRFGQSLRYAVKGVLTAGVIVVVAAPVYALAAIGPDARARVGLAVAGLLVAYGVLVLLGVIGEVAWGRIVAQHEAATGRHPLERFRGDDSEVAD